MVVRTDRDSIDDLVRSILIYGEIDHQEILFYGSGTECENFHAPCILVIVVWSTCRLFNLPELEEK